MGKGVLRAVRHETIQTGDIIIRKWGFTVVFQYFLEPLHSPFLVKAHIFQTPHTQYIVNVYKASPKDITQLFPQAE